MWNLIIDLSGPQCYQIRYRWNGLDVFSRSEGYHGYPDDA